jgi:hypothetical protein
MGKCVRPCRWFNCFALLCFYVDVCSGAGDLIFLIGFFFFFLLFYLSGLSGVLASIDWGNRFHPWWHGQIQSFFYLELKAGSVFPSFFVKRGAGRQETWGWADVRLVSRLGPPPRCVRFYLSQTTV